MQFLTDILAMVSGWFRPHLTQVSITMVATLLMIYGGDLCRLLKGQISRYHFLVRVVALVILCSGGCAAITVFATRVITRNLESLSNGLLGPVVCGLFFLIGTLAERKRYL
ncbi:MAG: DUF3392 family protein [bacterium]